MATVRYTYDPAKPAMLTDEQRARLDSLTQQQIEANALDDTDNTPLTVAECATVYRPGDIRDYAEGSALANPASRKDSASIFALFKNGNRGGASPIKSPDPICGLSV